MRKRSTLLSVAVFRIRQLILVLLMGSLSLASSGWAADALLDFDTKEQAALYLQLTKDHRCLKCQNQNLADSNASIAQDLKREIYDRVIAGDSEETISSYLVSRYGDFVLYRPPFKATTYALWIGPFVLLLGALWYALRIGRRSRSSQTTADNAALSRARKLLDD